MKRSEIELVRRIPQIMRTEPLDFSASLLAREVFLMFLIPQESTDERDEAKRNSALLIRNLCNPRAACFHTCGVRKSWRSPLRLRFPSLQLQKQAARIICRLMNQALHIIVNKAGKTPSSFSPAMPVFPAVICFFIEKMHDWFYNNTKHVQPVSNLKKNQSYRRSTNRLRECIFQQGRFYIIL